MEGEALLLLLPSSQSFFCETRSRAGGLTEAPSNAAQKCGPSKGSFINEAERRSLPVRQSYQCLAKTEDQPSPADRTRRKSARISAFIHSQGRGAPGSPRRLNERWSESRCWSCSPLAAKEKENEEVGGPHRSRRTSRRTEEREEVVGFH